MYKYLHNMLIYFLKNISKMIKLVLFLLITILFIFIIAISIVYNKSFPNENIKILRFFYFKTNFSMVLGLGGGAFINVTSRLYIHPAGMLRNPENWPRVWNFLTEWGSPQGLDRVSYLVMFVKFARLVLLVSCCTLRHVFVCYRVSNFFSFLIYVLYISYICRVFRIIS